MSKAGVEQLLYTMDEAFESNSDHSVLGNLGSVRDEDWLWVPTGGGRSIFELVQHVGECKYVYDNHAFGDGSMHWRHPGTVPTIDRELPIPAVIDWLREGQRGLRDHVAAFEEDGELLKQRASNWGQSYETRWLINVTIQHDLYHAGEVNHIRALAQDTDRWPVY